MIVTEGASRAQTAPAAGASSGKARSAPAERDERLDAGQKAYDEDDFVKAIEELNASLAVKPTARAALLLGNSHLKLNQFEEAKAAFGMVVQLDKKGSKRTEVQRLIKLIESLASAKLRIDSVPSGATVYIDLKAAGPRGKTPIDLSVLPGRHRVITSLEGFDEGIAVPDPVAISGKDTEVVVTLRQKGCDVALDSKTPDVMATIDGGQPFALPTTQRVGPGVHRVVISGKQLVPKMVPFDCKDFKPVTINEALDLAPGGVLSIRAQGGWEIFVDSQQVQASEAANLIVRPGTHHVEVQEAGKTPWHADVEIHTGEQLEVRPKPQIGQLGATGIEVTPTPLGSVIYLDGKPLPPSQLTVVRPGKHIVEAREKGYHPYVDVFDIEAGQIVHVEARPKRRSMVPLGLAITGTLVAAGLEGMAIFSHFKAGEQVSGSSQYKTWNALEIAGHSTAGAVFAASVVGYVIHFAIQNRRGLEGPPRELPKAQVSGAVTPNGGAVVLTGSF